MIEEIWKTAIWEPSVPYKQELANKYEVSNLGRMRNKKTGYILKGSKDYKGYLIFSMNAIDSLGRNRRPKARIHRLVANTFFRVSSLSRV